MPCFHPRHVIATVLVAVGLAMPIAAQEQAPTPEPSPRLAPAPFSLGGEIRFHFRDSAAVSVLDQFPFPPSFLPPGETQVFLRTVDAGQALELSTATLTGAGEIASHVFARVEVHFGDLYNRNPTSSDDRIKVRDAWVRFGSAVTTLETGEGTTGYLTVGLTPRFTKQLNRRLESYGLWGTALGRFEEPQVQAGGIVDGAVYWRAMVANGNPVFFRDTNALAGDNGTPERQPNNVHPIFESGFPILYDAQPADLSTQGRFEWGAGLGFKTGDEETAIDVLGWFFSRKMEDNVRMRGTTYGGDLQLLRGVFVPLPFSGDRKREFGANVEARHGGGRFFGQYVDQKIAGLPRKGFEAEVAWRFETNGLLLLGEAPLINWFQPVARFSKIDNKWTTPREYPGPSVGWDWTKLDVGLRIGIVRDVDLTVEYSRHGMKTAAANLHPDETLITLRAGF